MKLLDRILWWLGLERTIRVTMRLRGGATARFTCSKVDFTMTDTQLEGIKAERVRGMPNFVAMNQIVLLDTQWWVRRAKD